MLRNETRVSTVSNDAFARQRPHNALTQCWSTPRPPRSWSARAARQAACRLTKRGSDHQTTRRQAGKADRNTAAAVGTCARDRVEHILHLLSNGQRHPVHAERRRHVADRRRVGRCTSQQECRQLATHAKQIEAGNPTARHRKGRGHNNRALTVVKPGHELEGPQPILAHAGLVLAHHGSGDLRDRSGDK